MSGSGYAGQAEPRDGPEVGEDRGTRPSESRNAGVGSLSSQGPAIPGQANWQAGGARPDRTQALATSGGRSGTEQTDAPMSNYAFFVKYTYSNECALLAYNFNELVTKLGIFDLFAYRHDHRLISVTLAYILYRYQVHHCDMALDLALTLVYLEELRLQVETRPELQERGRDAFNLICYMAFLAHAFNSDRPIRLADWFKEIGWRSFKNCHQLNAYVFFLFSQVRGFKLRVNETQVKRYIQKLCSVPNQIHT